MAQLQPDGSRPRRAGRSGGGGSGAPRSPGRAGRPGAGGQESGDGSGDATRTGRPSRGGAGRAASAGSGRSGGPSAGGGRSRSSSYGGGSSAGGGRPGAPRPSTQPRTTAPGTGWHRPGGGPRLPDPAIDEDVTGAELDRAARSQLRTLSKENAEGVAQHLVMVSRLIHDEPEAALAHAEVAARRAGRVAAVREALGLVAYRLGDFQRALRELRTARRLSGTDHLTAHIADCERGLGEPERALAVIRAANLAGLDESERVELAIVASGARRDLGQLDAAVAVLEIPALRRRSGASPRLAYAYADALFARGDLTAARTWFARAAELDVDLETDAAERLDEIDGVVVIDALAEDELAEDADDSVDPGEHEAGQATGMADPEGDQA